MYDEGMPPHADNYTHGRYPWESTFFREHPDYYACDRDWQKRHWGVPEYAYPEVREYKLRELAHLVDRYEVGRRVRRDPGAPHARRAR